LSPIIGERGIPDSERRRRYGRLPEPAAVG
jgi:hypothetical protein